MVAAPRLVYQRQLLFVHAEPWSVVPLQTVSQPPPPLVQPVASVPVIAAAAPAPETIPAVGVSGARIVPVPVSLAACSPALFLS